MLSLNFFITILCRKLSMKGDGKLKITFLFGPHKRGEFIFCKQVKSELRSSFFFAIPTVRLKVRGKFVFDEICTIIK